MTADVSAPAVSTEATYRVHPQVSIRPEPFGALLYHFGNRKLSFLKDRTLFLLIETLGEGSTLPDAMNRIGIAESDRDLMIRSVEALLRSDMLQEVTS